MKFENIKHIFFDLDHTLWDFDKNSHLTFEKIFQLNNIPVDLDEFLQIYVPLNLEFWKLYREEKIDKQTLRYKRLSDTFHKLEVDVKSSMINKLSDDYIKYLTTFNHLFGGTKEVLEYLNQKYKLHIITNGFKEVQHGKLNQSGIDHYFTTVTNSEMVGVKKPNRRIFDHALEKAKAKPHESVMIGDNYEADILGALNVGMGVLFFDYHNENVDHNLIEIIDLYDIKKFL